MKFEEKDVLKSKVMETEGGNAGKVSVNKLDLHYEFYEWVHGRGIDLPSNFSTCLGQNHSSIRFTITQINKV